MADNVSKILSGGFLGLGEVFSNKIAPAFQQFQNSFTPNPRPVNDNNFSFNFAGAVQALTRPFQKVTDPAAAAKTDIINSIGSGLSGIIGAVSNKAIDLIKNANKKPETVTTTGLQNNQPMPSQNTGGASLGDILSFFNAARPATPALTTSEQIAKQAGQNALFSTVLVGGAAIALLLLAKGK